jgi:hypothetical protein
MDHEPAYDINTFKQLHNYFPDLDAILTESQAEARDDKIDQVRAIRKSRSDDKLFFDELLFSLANINGILFPFPQRDPKPY